METGSRSSWHSDARRENRKVGAAMQARQQGLLAGAGGWAATCRRWAHRRGGRKGRRLARNQPSPAPCSVPRRACHRYAPAAATGATARPCRPTGPPPTASSAGRDASTFGFENLPAKERTPASWKNTGKKQTLAERPSRGSELREGGHDIIRSVRRGRLRAARADRRVRFRRARRQHGRRLRPAEPSPRLRRGCTRVWRPAARSRRLRRGGWLRCCSASASLWPAGSRGVWTACSRWCISWWCPARVPVACSFAWICAQIFGAEGAS